MTDDYGTVNERTRILDNESSDGDEASTNKQETWSDVKPYIRPLVACNFISVVCGLNDGSIVSLVILTFKQGADLNVGCNHSAIERFLQHPERNRFFIVLV